jgi:hypothetical protein
VKPEHRSNITYIPHSGSTLESEAAVLAAAYRVVLEAAKRREKAGAPNAGNDGKETKNAPANGIIPR